MVALLFYLFWWNNYVTDDRLPIMDLTITVILALLWLVGTFCFSSTAGQVEDATSQESVGKLLEAGKFCIGKNLEKCDYISYAVYAPLTVSTIAGVSCTILYLANIWFCYKETAGFRARNSRTIQMDHDPYTLE